MLGLAVTLNGEKLAAVSTEGNNLIDVRVHGDMISADSFATVDVSGGRFGENDSLYLTWVDERELRPGDELEVALLDPVETSHPGKTIEELFPGEPKAVGPWKPNEHVFAELALKPKVRDGFGFRLSSPHGEVSARTQPGDHSFGFSVGWNSFQPGRARVSLHSYTLQGIANRSGGTDHANFLLQPGQRVTLHVDV